MQKFSMEEAMKGVETHLEGTICLNTVNSTEKLYVKKVKKEIVVGFDKEVVEEPTQMLRIRDDGGGEWISLELNLSRGSLLSVYPRRKKEIPPSDKESLKKKLISKIFGKSDDKDKDKDEVKKFKFFRMEDGTYMWKGINGNVVRKKIYKDKTGT